MDINELLKMTAKKKAKFLRQMDDDLPMKSRAKWLKTIRVLKIPKIQGIRKR